MKKIIFIILLSIVFISCNNSVSCDSSKVKKTALRLFETEIRVQLAWGKYYEKVFAPMETFNGRQMTAFVQLLSAMEGNDLPGIEELKLKALNEFRQLINGETVEDAEKYQPYIRYADSIMDLGKISLEIIMTTANHPKLKKCECEAVLVFDPEIDFEDMDVNYEVQEASDGEVYVAIWRLE